MPNHKNLKDAKDVSWMRNEAMPLPEQCDQLRMAMAHQRRLKEHVAKLLKSCIRGEIASSSRAADPADALEACQAELEGLDEFWSTMLKATFYNEYIPENETRAAQRVFDVPELLEMVLEYTSICDILNFQQVCRSARDAIDGSPRLQRVLNLRAEPEGSHFQTPYCCFTHGNLGGFWCGTCLHGLVLDGTEGSVTYNLVNIGSRYRSSVCVVGNNLTVSAGFPNSDERLPRIGSRWRAMYICQPPIKQMTIRLACCSHDAGIGGVLRSAKEFTVTSESGLTIGDLYDKTKALVAEHRFCLAASTYQHDYETGLVKVDPSFSTTITLRGGDPLVQKKVGYPDIPVPPVVPPFGLPLPPSEKEREDRIKAYQDYKGRGKPTFLLQSS
jgi:hypothetical protein